MIKLMSELNPEVFEEVGIIEKLEIESNFI